MCINRRGSVKAELQNSWREGGLQKQLGVGRTAEGKIEEATA
jgi:hypothetical protein